MVAQPDRRHTGEMAPPRHERREAPRFRRRQYDAIKSACPLEEVAIDYGEFRLVGNGRLLGRCVSPAHMDETPSMHIFPAEGRFKCFGIACGRGGDVLDLVCSAEERRAWGRGRTVIHTLDNDHIVVVFHAGGAMEDTA